MRRECASHVVRSDEAARANLFAETGDHGFTLGIDADQKGALGGTCRSRQGEGFQAPGPVFHPDLVQGSHDPVLVLDMAHQFGFFEETGTMDLQTADDGVLKITQHVAVQAVAEGPQEDQRAQTDGDGGQRTSRFGT